MIGGMIYAMIDMYDERVEEVILSKLHDHEAARHSAERRLEAIRNEIMEEDRAVEHWRFVLQDYRKSHGLPVRPSNPSPVLEAEFYAKGPTELVQYWADRHEGEVVVKELAKVAFNAGLFSKYRNASSSIYAVVKRKGYKRVGPGRFLQPENASETEGHRFAMSFESKGGENETSISV